MHIGGRCEQGAKASGWRCTRERRRQRVQPRLLHAKCTRCARCGRAVPVEGVQGGHVRCGGDALRDRLEVMFGHGAPPAAGGAAARRAAARQARSCCDSAGAARTTERASAVNGTFIFPAASHSTARRSRAVCSRRCSRRHGAPWHERAGRCVLPARPFRALRSLFVLVPRVPPLTRCRLCAPAGVPTFKLVLVGDGGTGASPRRGDTARAKPS